MSRWCMTPEVRHADVSVCIPRTSLVEDCVPTVYGLFYPAFSVRLNINNLHFCRYPIYKAGKRWLCVFVLLVFNCSIPTYHFDTYL